MQDFGEAKDVGREISGAIDTAFEVKFSIRYSVDRCEGRPGQRVDPEVVFSVARPRAIISLES